jgi:hypothetical protein
VFGYQNHVSIGREFGLIRRWAATDAAAYEGARLHEGLLDRRPHLRIWLDATSPQGLLGTRWLSLGRYPRLASRSVSQVDIIEQLLAGPLDLAKPLYSAELKPPERIDHAAILTSKYQFRLAASRALSGYASHSTLVS